MSSGGGSGPRGTGGTGGGAGGAGGGSSSKGVASSERQGDGSLTVTPDSPADAEWRARKGPLDGVGEITGPWGEEDSTGTCHLMRTVIVEACATPPRRTHPTFGKSRNYTQTPFADAERLLLLPSALTPPSLPPQAPNPWTYTESSRGRSRTFRRFRKGNCDRTCLKSAG